MCTVPAKKVKPKAGRLKLSERDRYTIILHRGLFSLLSQESLVRFDEESGQHGFSCRTIGQFLRLLAEVSDRVEASFLTDGVNDLEDKDGNFIDPRDHYPFLNRENTKSTCPKCGDVALLIVDGGVNEFVCIECGWPEPTQPLRIIRERKAVRS